MWEDPCSPSGSFYRFKEKGAKLMKRQKRQRIFMAVMAAFLALLMLLPIVANIFLAR